MSPTKNVAGKPARKAPARKAAARRAPTRTAATRTAPARKAAARNAPARTAAARKAPTATHVENDRLIHRITGSLDVAQADLGRLRGSVGSGVSDLRRDLAKLLRSARRDAER